MNSGLTSGREACLRLCNLPDFSTRKPGPHSSSGLVFKTRLEKPSISIRAPCGSDRYRARVATDDAVREAAGAAEESFYELLGVPHGETPSEIKKAYKQMALKYHPDVSPPNRVEEYTRTFIRVQEAYKTLSDPKARALYDRDLATAGLNLGFARTRFQYDQDWNSRARWESQLAELKRRSANKEEGRGRRGDMSWWGARTLRQRSQRFGLGFD